jgi:sugar phosphate isomerase/epimerase
MTVPQLISRRRFLATAGALPALAVSQSFLGRAFAGAPARKYPIGIELYAVRGELTKDLPNTLRTVAQLGYEAVEFYSPYFQWSFPYAKEVRALLDDVGLRCYSTHNQFASLTAGETMAKAIELNQILGVRHIVLASAPPGTAGSESWKRLSDRLAAAVEELRPHGLTTGFHNHRREWNPLDNGQRAMDIIAANTPKDFVLQLDVGTCVEAGVDPVAWIEANPGRIRSLHLKDWAPGTREEEKSYRVLFGEGVAPWQKIFAAAESVGGVEFYLMEQEGSRYSEFETAKRCMDTWKAMRKG